MVTVTRSATAAVLRDPGERLVMMELGIPALREGQVLVRVHYAGLCGSQLHEVRGRRGVDRFLPHTLGHEGSGIVEEVGSGVTKVSPGDHVVATWIRADGLESVGTQYTAGGSFVNSGPVSTFLTRSVISENRVVRIPFEMPLREAALLGCAVPTGGGLVYNSGLEPGGSVAVFGTGGVGLSAVLAAVSMGARPLIAVDVSERKLRKAMELGATDSIDASRENPVARIMTLTGGRGADLAVEAAGNSDAMRRAHQCVRPGGGICIIAGNLPHGGRIEIDPMDLIRGRQLRGTWGGETIPDQDVPKYVVRFLDGQLPLGKLLTNDFALHEIDEAFDRLERGELDRALIRMLPD